MEQENNNNIDNLENNVQNETFNNENINQNNIETMTNAENISQENNTQPIDNGESANGGHKFLIVLLIILLIGAGIFIYYLMNKPGENPTPKPDERETQEKETPSEQEKEQQEPTQEDNSEYLAYQIKSNSIGDFDLKFLKLENKKKNIIYSPLSIKYALEMLKEGTAGESKKQIERIVGDYTPKKYQNNKNMSFANALFIKDSYKDSVKDKYINTLTQSYNAAVIYDSFKTPNNINKWISEKTFNLINNLLDDISTKDFILANALAIDMEWVEKIQREEMGWDVSYVHEDYYNYVSSLNDGFTKLKFENNKNVAAVEFKAVSNRYDIVKVMGESKVRETVGNAYQAWLDSGAPESCYDPEYSDESEKDPDRETFVNNYIEEINTNYNKTDSSTDFGFYIDDSVKVFSKDLKEYSGTTLQYVAIMPTKTELSKFIENNTANNITTLINKIKPIKSESFEDGVITELTGYVPMFKFNHQLNLIEDLEKLGITDIFDLSKADLSNLTTQKAFISDALHQSTIEFSNSGIKAAAVTVLGGAGAGECGFDYIFKISAEHIKKVDLTFNKPFLFLILDKNTKEVWFAGSVYEPSEYDNYIKNVKFEEDWE